MGIAKHNVFAQQTVKGKMLHQTTHPATQSVGASECACLSTCLHTFLKSFGHNTAVKADQEPVGAFGTRGRWTRRIPATSSSGVGKQVMGEQVLEELEVLEDEGFQHAMMDQHGSTKYPYKVSV